ncbi:MAG: (2Fe-2S)-binding protein [Planctomycetes bacterium]|nr:(2Fe-2S)-binding protein [Planctomycetota bacterium]
MAEPDRLPYEGPLPGADAVGESGSMSAGPGVRISFRIDDEARIAAAAFETASLDGARIVASKLCGAVLGATVFQASAVSIPDLALMAGLPLRDPAVRIVHFAKSAAMLPHLGRAAIAGPGITCTCFRVATATIVAAIERMGLRTADQVKDATNAGSGCGSCRPQVEGLIKQHARRD